VQLVPDETLTTILSLPDCWLGQGSRPETSKAGSNTKHATANGVDLRSFHIFVNYRNIIESGCGAGHDDLAAEHIFRPSTIACSASLVRMRNT
jgi:hypothetical protein